jgi:hypothetical protein
MDETIVDLDDREAVTISQIDEFGTVHTVILCPLMVDQTLQLLLRWTHLNQTYALLPLPPS